MSLLHNNTDSNIQICQYYTTYTHNNTNMSVLHNNTQIYQYYTTTHIITHKYVSITQHTYNNTNMSVLHKTHKYISVTQQHTKSHKYVLPLEVKHVHFLQRTYTRLENCNPHTSEHAFWIYQYDSFMPSRKYVSTNNITWNSHFLNSWSVQV
jgi:hypothetical protein